MKRRQESESEEVPHEAVNADTNNENMQKVKRSKVSRSVKKKRLQRKSKGSKPVAEPPTSKSRDFASDLHEYLVQWEFKEQEGSMWKFNKVLQAWAIANCTDGDKIKPKLFKKLMPYLDSVQGGTRIRLQEVLKNIILPPNAVDGASNSVADSAEEIEQKLKKLKRAEKILMYLQS
jgi:hypothetical protein